MRLLIIDSNWYGRTTRYVSYFLGPAKAYFHVQYGEDKGNNTFKREAWDDSDVEMKETLERSE